MAVDLLVFKRGKMVKTRHSGDLDESLDDEFMSLRPRGTRGKSLFSAQMNGYESTESGEVEFVSRSTRRRVHKDPIIDESGTSDTEESDELDDREEDDDDEDDDDEDDDDDDDNESNNNNRRRGRRAISFRALSLAGKNKNKHGKSPVRRSTRRESKSPAKRRASKSPVRKADRADMNGDYERRRSSRQRKLTYGSFNEKDIDRHHNLVQRSVAYEHRSRSKEFSSPERKRTKFSEVEKLKKDAGKEIDGYGRSTRQRRKLQRDIYGMEITPGKKEEGDTSQGDTEDTEASTATETETGDSSSDESEPQQRGRYSLREHKPTTSRYMAPMHEPRRPRNRSRDMFRESTPPTRSRKNSKPTYQSPARRRTGNFRRRSPTRRAEDRRRKAFHDSDSTSSDGSSSGDSDDERRFQRRKAKSMAKQRGRLLPMNFTNDDMATGILRDRTRAGASMADIDPMDLDRSVTFDSIGGLGKHLRKLKEMIVFPLMYPEVFDKFKIAPPRGVLFYGPPGTGKTLVARALANECSTGDRKVAFFMRKGADCLSKWVGESERQLRLLFDQAYQMRPSVIFFDEIDGLAPVRSSKQDQIHSSLVSTLLALMDGLDNRGEIVVIGATNRIDSIDPALRRPGRFDREFLFPLPSLEARAQILKIHTKQWNPSIRSAFLEELATQTVGYCGADLKSLCTEAALHALRRRYPQIYLTNDKLQLDVTSIEVSAKDFSRAMDGIVPTAQRSASAPGRALIPSIKPLIGHIFEKALNMLMESFPAMQLAQMASLDVPDESAGAVDIDDYSDDDENMPSIFEATARNGRLKKRHSDDETRGSFLSFTSNTGHSPVTHRPRMLLSGHPGQGQSSHVAPALLHAMEKLPVHTLDLPALYAVSVKTAEESCADVFREARRTSPSIVYMPHIGEWWDVVGDTVRSTFMALLRDVEASMPLLLLATSEVVHSQLPTEIKQLFNASSGEVVSMHNPTDAQRREYFQDILLNQTKRPPPSKQQTEYELCEKTGLQKRVHFAHRALELLPKAPPPEPRKLTDKELKQLNQQEEATMRELRLFLRDILNKLGRDRKFQIFAKPVDEEEVPDYYEIIKEPMDLSTMMSKIDLHQYQTVHDFLNDIELICRNALEYNPDKDPQNRKSYTRIGRAIRHRACTLKDTTMALLNAELDPDFEKLCKDIAESRKKQGQNAQSTVPDYYFTKPLDRPGLKPLENCLPVEYRKRGANESNNNSIQENGTPGIRKVLKRVLTGRSSLSAKKKPLWCRSTRKRKFKYIEVYIDEHGNEIPDPNAPKGTKETEGETEETASEEGKEDSDENIPRSSPRYCGNSPRDISSSQSPGGRSPRTRGSDSSPRGTSSGKSPNSNNNNRSRSPSRRSRSRSRSSGRSPNRSRHRSNSPRRSSGNSPASKSPRNKRGESPRRRSQSPSGRKSDKKSDDEMDVDDEKANTRVRSTRGRQKAADILHSQTPDVKIDEGHLRRLLDVTVRQTHNFNVEKLEKLFSRYSQCIFRHRYEPNKAELIKDMENTLDKFCSSHW